MSVPHHPTPAVTHVKISHQHPVSQSTMSSAELACHLEAHKSSMTTMMISTLTQRLRPIEESLATLRNEIKVIQESTRTEYNYNDQRIVTLTAKVEELSKKISDVAIRDVNMLLKDNGLLINRAIINYLQRILTRVDCAGSLKSTLIAKMDEMIETRLNTVVPPTTVALLDTTASDLIAKIATLEDTNTQLLARLTTLERQVLVVPIASVIPNDIITANGADNIGMHIPLYDLTLNSEDDVPDNSLLAESLNVIDSPIISGQQDSNNTTHSELVQQDSNNTHTITSDVNVPVASNNQPYPQSDDETTEVDGIPPHPVPNTEEMNIERTKVLDNTIDPNDVVLAQVSSSESGEITNDANNDDVDIDLNGEVQSTVRRTCTPKTRSSHYSIVEQISHDASRDYKRLNANAYRCIIESREYDARCWSYTLKWVPIYTGDMSTASINRNAVIFNSYMWSMQSETAKQRYIKKRSPRLMWINGQYISPTSNDY